MKNRLMVLALVGMAGQSLAGGLFFSEYCEGSSNNKYLEIYNATGASVDLSTVTVKHYNNGGTSPTAAYMVTLSGTLAADDVYVLCNNAAVQAIKNFSDLILPATGNGSSVCWFNGDDAMALEVNSVTVDVIGRIGFDPGTSWTVGTDATGALDNTIVRSSAVCDGFVSADNANWIAVGAPQWTVYPMDTFTYGGAHTAFCGGGNVPPVIGAITYTPNPVSAGDLMYFDATITDSDGSVSLAILHYGTTPGSLTNSLPLDPIGGNHFASSSPITAPAACQNLYYKVEAMDNLNDTAISGEFAAPVQCELTIPQIQGGVSSSPYVGQVVTTEGQVSVVQSTTSMFIQDDNGPWHGIQVFGAHPGVVEGDFIRVTGSVLEYNGFTEIAGSLSIQVLSTPGPLTIVPQVITVGQALAEDYEGVLVRVENTTCVGSVDPNTYVFDGVDQILIYAPGFTGVEDACYSITGVRYAYQGTAEIAIRTLADIVDCGVVEGRDELKTFALGKAFPNPFNPSAQISFSLDRTASAHLSVFNVLGQEVAVLVDGVLEAGAHQVTFDAAALPSGLYFYNLQSEGRQLTGRMTLVR